MRVLARTLPALTIAAIVAASNPAAAALRSGFAADVPRAASLRDLGRAPAATRIGVALTLRYRNAAELDELVRMQADRRSPLYRHFLSTAQFDDYFAPAPTDYARAIVALEQAGFRITQTFENRTLIDASAPAATVERYFATEIRRVRQADAGIRFLNSRPATLPAALRAVASTVEMNDVVVARPTFRFANAISRVQQRGLARAASGPVDGPRVESAPEIGVPDVPEQAGRIETAAANVVADPGFESDAYAHWGQCGSVAARIASNLAHRGHYSEFAGSTSSAHEITGDGGLCQAVTVPASGVLSFYAYENSNETSAEYAYAWGALLDSKGRVLDTLYRTVTKTRGWTKKTYSLAKYAGARVYLYFGVHGDGYAKAYTQQYVDDVAVVSGSHASPTPAPTTQPTSAPTATPAPGCTSANAIGGSLRGPDGGFGPLAVAGAYDLPVQHGCDGTGRSVGVAISGDFSESDLAQYLKYYGIARTGPATTRVEIDGGAPYSATLTPSNASLESTLDAETIVGNAPGAHLYMYIFPDLSSQSIEDGYNRAVSDDAVDVLNSSFGGCETNDSAFASSVDEIATQAAAKGITFVASSGDAGADACGSDENAVGVSTPASAPHVVAVGGTSLAVDSGGGYGSETAWSGSGSSGGSGGGVSTQFAVPAYQNGVAGVVTSGRNLPDVAFAGDPSTGTSYYFGTGGSSAGWNGPIGGTSWSSPIFCAFLAETNERDGARAGYVNQRLYTAYATYGYATDFHDVTSGNNGAYAAKAGFDQVTGVGSLRGFALSGNL